MPTYQYACTECDHRFEAVQSFTDAALTECPECTGRLRKLFSAVGIVFKGSGFYRTDSRTGSTSPNTSSNSKSESTSESSTTASASPVSESKSSSSGSSSSASKPAAAAS